MSYCTKSYHSISFLIYTTSYHITHHVMSYCIKSYHSISFLIYITSYHITHHVMSYCTKSYHSNIISYHIILSTLLLIILYYMVDWFITSYLLSMLSRSFSKYYPMALGVLCGVTQTHRLKQINLEE